MASERDLIAAEHSEKLRELFYLVSSALQPLPDFTYSSASTTASNFFDKNDISVNKPFLVTSLPKVRDYETLKREIAASAQTYIYQTEEKNVNGKRPRDATTFSSSSRILNNGVSSTPSGIPQPTHRGQKPTTMSQNLRSQIECIEKETDEYLNKRISDLDIITLPESYPTNVHNSTSLAELHYLTQLFPLIKLLPGSHKALMTENFELALLEGKVSVLYSRIEELKRQKKWSLRQPQRYLDPFLYSKRHKKGAFTWDSVLREGKWMATDFKESLKFRKLCCAQLAQAVREYWIHGKVVCIKTKPIEYLPSPQIEAKVEDEDAEMLDIPSEENSDAVAMDVDEEPAAELAADLATEPIASQDAAEVKDLGVIDPTEETEQEAVKQEIPEISSVDPANLVSTEAGLDEYDIDLLKSTPEPPKPPISEGPFKSHININDLKKIDQSIIRNLPKFTAFDDDSISSLLSSTSIAESAITPTSKLLYPPEPDDDWYKVVLRDSTGPALSGEDSGPPPYQKGLFGVQSHRKFNFLKPPKPPLVKNIKYRSPTMWLPRDDRFLIHYVAEYCFNWELIAANLLAQSSTLKHYTTNIEKRTPWQCFERYIQLNDKFQFRDMKGPNAAPAQIWLEEAHNAQMSTKRRISPLGVGNESIQRGHRKLRWASMFDAMRKTMRRRELAAVKASSRKATPDHTASSANSNSSSYPAGQTAKRPVDNASTPQELSKLKHDRDKAIQEAYFQRQASRSRLKSGLVQRRPDLLTGSGSSPAPSGPMDTSSGGPSRATIEAQRRMQQQRAAQAASSSPSDGPRAASAGHQNGLQGTMGAGQLSHVALAQHQANQLLGNMKAALPNSKAFTPEQMQKAIQLEKQRLLLQQQQGSMTGSGAGQSSRQLLSGRKIDSVLHPGSSPTMLGAGQSRSPTAKQAGPAAKGRLLYSPSQFAAIVNTIQQKNPNMSKEQAKKVAALYLANLQQQQQASRAAQGGSSSSNAQEALKARQAQLAARKAALPAKDSDALGLKPEERGKMILTQDLYPRRTSSSPYTRTSGSRANSPMDTSLQYPSNDKKR